jgi:hypothetical protein
MAGVTIKCPSCGTEFPLDEAMMDRVRDEVSEEIEAEAVKKAKAETSLEIADLRAQLDEKEKQLEESQDAELALRKRERKVKQKEKTLELQIARGVEDEREKIIEEVTADVEDKHKLATRKKDEELKSLRKKIDELKRRAEQGSQQLQGEVAELELEDLLAQAFPSDEIVSVGKGVKGADVLQRVHVRPGQYHGTIIWECKNTKNWSNGWIPKLKDNQRAEKAELAAIVSVALPKGMREFGEVDGVWVMSFESAIPVASVLRQLLIGVSQARMAAVGKDEKMDLLYSYLSGPQFKQRVEGMLEPFLSMRDELQKEKLATEKAWAQRERHMDRMLRSVAGMYGDIQGITGALPVIERLELPAPTEQ